MGSIIQHKLPIVDFTKENLNLELHDEVFHAMEELFNLPMSTKVQNKSNKPLFGYVGQIPIVPLYKSIGIDDANTMEGMQKFEKVMWPNGNDGFSEVILLFSKLIAELEQWVVRMVFESYGVEKYYESHLNSISYLCRVMKYRNPKKESNMGFVTHTDKNFMTILHQNQVDGLEIKAKDGQWFGVELCPSSFVVMAGDAIMAWSNGRIHSPHHRATMNGNKARYSLGQFLFMKGTVKTPEELVDDKHPLQYKPFDHLEFLDFYSQPENRRLGSAIRTYCGI
ncbi:2-oxoglutarate-dependent dioxygenase AOP1.2 [Actinidia chinensis var. chinensis]|uniref:2-oxoglutarate-dependent dioxygenase AOP1.2 n=1 Tax=Actinidia chinensis var. chinensis TaxID=1590841 RepID=A0A2R6QFT3_ACTCC|nr:2-oxoglutarate-dependent dioxygenase AOP1.2 [Actinidia chinensis var. chinensis]